MGHSKMADFLMRAMGLAFLTAVSFFIGPSSACGNGHKLAQELRDNVVQVAAVNRGFGFIVGEQSGKAYIVTAYHLLCRLWPCEDGTEKDKGIEVCFYRSQDTCLKAELVVKDKRNDLIVLRAPLPAGQRWRKNVMGSVEALEDHREVWYVGREGEWYIPSLPGAFNRLEPSENLLVLDMRIKGGTSGAPVISETGIVGMLMAAKGSDVSRALTIDFIKTGFRARGLPWDLVQDPYSDPLVAEAKRYYDFRLYQDAFKAFEKAAAKGRVRAMTMLGLMYLNGDGVTANRSQALLWFNKAVGGGDPMAMALLGVMYESGTGVPKDGVQALHWYTKAAEEGDPEALYHLAQVYELGRLGVVQNFNEALKLYRRACKAGYRPAERRLAELGKSCE